MEIIKDKNDIQYREAVRKVKRIKSFYTHLIIYVLVNLFLIFANWSEIREEHSIWTWQIWAVPFFWGIGLAAQAVGVFCPGFFFGKDWEDKKIKELTEKYK